MKAKLKSSCLPEDNDNDKIDDKEYHHNPPHHYDIIIITIITLETLRSAEGCARRLKRLECEIYIPPPINFTTLSKIITVSIAFNPYLFLHLGAHQLYNT